MDLASLSALLISLGVGPFAASAITLGITTVLKWLRSRNGAPVVPSPVGPSPAPAPSNTPIRDLMRELLNKLLAPKPVAVQSLPVDDDMSPAEALAVLKKLDEIKLRD